MAATAPYYLLRLVGGAIFLAGAVLMAFNLYMTMAGQRTVQVRPPAVATGEAAA
jgi:cytochrome c oxidase cbb3-type subunit 1